MEAVALKKYYVLGKDGKEYGPASVATLCAWAKEGRLKENTILVDENGAKISAYCVHGIFLPIVPPVQQEQEVRYERSLAQSMVFQAMPVAAAPAGHWQFPPTNAFKMPESDGRLTPQHFLELRVQKMDNRVLVPHAALVTIIMLGAGWIPFVSFGLLVYLFIFGIYCLFFRRNGSAYLAATLSLGVFGIVVFLMVAAIMNAHLIRR